MVAALVQALADMPAWLLISIALLATALIVLISVAVAMSQRQPPILDPSIPGQSGEALTTINDRGGEILVNGECWSARSARPIPPGHAVRILAVRGLRLTVEQLEPDHDT